MDTPTGRRARARPTPRARLNGGRRHADELSPDRKLAAIAALCSPARSRADCGPLPIPGQVGPRTSRPARGLQKAAPKEGLVAGRAPGTGLFAPLPERQIGRSADNGAPLWKSRALVAGTRRARPRRAPPPRSAARLEGARSGDNSVIAPAPGIPASGFDAARLDGTAAHERAVMRRAAAAGLIARARPARRHRGMMSRETGCGMQDHQDVLLH